MNFEEEDCSICGIPLKEKYKHSLQCNHKFHYECLLKTFTSNSKYEKKRCPYCKTKCNSLPMINGIKKPIHGIHYNTIEEFDNLEIKNTKCNHILLKGKRKGEECGKNCKIGYNVCQSHFKIKNEKKIDGNLSDKLGDKLEKIEIEIAEEISKKLAEKNI